MTHFPASLDMEEAFGTVAYKLRNMDADMHSYFQQVIESINESQTCADPIDPDVLLAGPLRGLGLLDEYRRIESLKASDPAGAFGVDGPHRGANLARGVECSSSGVVTTRALHADIRWHALEPSPQIRSLLGM